MRSLPDSLPRVVARYRPASKFLLPGRRRYDVAYRKETNVAMPIVAEQYAFVIGVDTHAATHSLALVTAATGGIVTEAVFPNSTPGLDRALRWITGKINGESALIVVEGVGSYGAGLAQRAAAAGLLVAEPSPMPAAERRGVGKTDALDAVRIARSVLGVDTSRLRWPRATGQRVVLRVLSVAREEMVAERTRAINALTALLRTVDLGVDTRKALPQSMFKVIAGWRERREDTVIATCRQEAIRLAKRIVASRQNWPTTARHSMPPSRTSPRSCASFPALAPSWLPACSWRGLTRAGCAPKRRSPRWQELVRSRPPRETLCDTDSTAVGTAA